MWCDLTASSSPVCLSFHFWKKVTVIISVRIKWCDEGKILSQAKRQIPHKCQLLLLLFLFPKFLNQKHLVVLVELSLQSREIELYKLIALTIWEGNDKNSLEDYILIRKCIFSAISVLKKEYYLKHSGIIPLWFDTKNRVFHFRKKCLREMMSHW